MRKSFKESPLINKPDRCRLSPLFTNADKATELSCVFGVQCT